MQTYKEIKVVQKKILIYFSQLLMKWRSIFLMVLDENTATSLEILANLNSI